MMRFFQMIANFFMDCWGLLDQAPIFDNLTVADFVLVSLIAMMCLGVFWKGARA